MRIPRSKSHVSLTNVMLAKIITRQLNQLDAESRKAFRYTMKNLTGIMSASLCSGAGTDSMVQRVLLAMFRPDLEHSTAYSVEYKAVKQKWLTTVVHAGEPDHCTFKDVAEVHEKDGKAYCVAHNRRCNIWSEHVRLTAAGTPCKNSSKLHNQRSEHKDCFVTRSGSSGNTMQLTVKHIEIHEPPVLLMENVNDLLEATFEESLLELKHCLAQAGYVMVTMQMD